jgi:hypothetical protein
MPPHLMDRDRTNGRPTDHQTHRHIQLFQLYTLMPLPIFHVFMYIFSCTCFLCAFHANPYCPGPLLYVPSERQIKKKNFYVVTNVACLPTLLRRSFFTGKSRMLRNDDENKVADFQNVENELISSTISAHRR